MAPLLAPSVAAACGGAVTCARGSMTEAAAKEVRLVVGVGASAGGLEAFKRLLFGVPSDAGMTFLLVQHLDPRRESLLAELLTPCTAMRVKQAEADEALEANTVYVIPPDASMAVRDGKIELSPPVIHRGARLAVDHLFRSLAREYGPRAVGIVLSGAGSDGSAGLRDLKAAGGMVLVQDPVTAAQPGMPQSAIATGAVDLVSPIEGMPVALQRFDELPELVRKGAPELSESEPPSPPAVSEPALERLATLLEATAGFNLRAYKRGTVGRRLLRRSVLGGHASVEAYLEGLSAAPAEQKAVVRDLLISVTDFFRDAGAFEVLRRSVIERLIDDAQSGESVRVWVAGCATGEEAYSLAIELLAMSERKGKQVKVQVFATDVDEEALSIARLGIYAPGLVESVPRAWLETYFAPVEGRGYQVRPVLRDVVSFAVHDVTKDPPFSRMNLVSCRNVLIYLLPHAQEHVLGALHFSLLPQGTLFLGSSETTGPQRDLFSTQSKAWRLFRKVGPSRSVRLPTGAYRPYAPNVAEAFSGRAAGDGPPRLPRRVPGAAELARRALMHARIAPSLVIAEGGQVLYMHGELRPFLRFPEGEPRFELASLVSPELATRTRAALHKCRREGQSVMAYSSLEGSKSDRVKITATPAPDLGEGTVILSFELVKDSAALAMPPDSPAEESVIEQLETELRATREDLRDTVEELESSTQELRSAHEEAISMNEELQSANEELEATTEELRSLNEELTTVNAQLREKVDQVERAHDDLSNFLTSTKIATIFLDERLSIKKFTPAAQELLQIDRADEGRFVGAIARELLQDGLVDEVKDVLENLTPRVRDQHTRDGRWITRRILPYRTDKRRIEGAVVTWTDVTELKLLTERLTVRERQQAVVARMGLHALEETNLQRFFDQCVVEIQQTLDVELCKLLELQPDHEVMLIRAGVGWKTGLVGNASVPAGIGSQAGYTLNAKAPVLVEDLREERRFTGPHLLLEHGVRSGMSCVIGGADEPYGVIGVHARSPRVFTPEDADFLLACAAVLAAAITRHESRTRMLLERAVAGALVDAETLSEALARIHAALVRELDVTVGEFWAPEAGGDFVRTELLSPSPSDELRFEAALAPARFSPGQGFVGRVATNRASEWLSSLQNPAQFARVDAARELGLRSGLAVPVVSGGDLLGVFTVFSTARLHADSSFLRSLDGIGRSLGDFVRRKEVERRYQTTVEAAPSGIAERSLDGHLLRVNERFCEIVGYPADELTHQGFQRLVYADDVAQEDQLFSKLRDEGNPSYDTEMRYVRKDGGVVWVSLSAARVSTASGLPDHVILVVDDISQRKATEQALRESEERFRLMLLRSPAPMMVYDDAGRVVALSRSWERVTGYSVDELPRVEDWMRRVFRMKDPEIEQAIVATWSQPASEREREVEAWRKDGSSTTLLVRAGSLGSTWEGRQLRVVAALDIEERRRFERQLLEASRQKDEFIAMLGHELRNPLAAVRSATELLKRTGVEDARLQRVFGVLDRQTNHMARLLDGLLDISRIIHGKIVLETQIVDLSALVRQVIADAQPRLGPGQNLRSEVAEPALVVEGDPVRLTQIVDNLISNAIKYTPADGCISVTLTGEGSEAVLQVKDSGEGIDPQLLPNLFKPFQQGHQSLDRKQGGLGLGLALVKVLADMHGGQVHAQGGGAGRGASFVVRLPLTAKRLPIALHGRPTPGPRKVLVIEDNLDAAEALRDALEAEGHTVVLAPDGRQGLEAARSQAPDAIFCDIGLPDGFTGYDVAKALRSDPLTRDLYIVALTGYGRDEDRGRCEAVGFNVHLTKPVSLDEIEATLARAPCHPA
ncbi:MAG: PAS domain S-box protein [Myxococcales bacterium]|nr:PAS domain S-box protein [Myxococcales bacterium]